MKVRNYRSLARRRWRRFRLRTYLFVGLAGLIAGGLVYFILFSTFFRARVITVAGNLTALDEPTIIAMLELKNRDSWLGSLLDEKHLLRWRENTTIRHPLIKSVSVRRDFFTRTILIKIEERIRAGIWCYAAVAATDPAACYWHDAAGIILGPAPETAGALLTQINDDRSARPAIGATVIEPRYFAILSHILAELGKNSLHFNSFRLDQAHQELSAITETGTRIVFSLRFKPTPPVFEFLKKLIDEKQLAKLNYVDLTVENRIYTK